MTATLTVTPLRIGGGEARRLTIECSHGRTTGDLITPGRGAFLDEDQLLRLLVARHEREEGCGCAWALLERGS